jgi:hypothetical protein
MSVVCTALAKVLVCAYALMTPYHQAALRQEYPLWFEYEALAAAWLATHSAKGSSLPEGGLYADDPEGRCVQAPQFWLGLLCLVTTAPFTD